MAFGFLRYNWKEKGHILECNKDLHGFWVLEVQLERKGSYFRMQQGPPWLLGGGGSGSNATDYVCDYDYIIVIPSKVKTKNFLEKATLNICCMLSKGQW
jgi:hypothetical protein